MHPPAAAAATRRRRPPHIMLVFSRFSPKKVPFEDTTEAVGNGGGAGIRERGECDEGRRASASGKAPTRI